jgi:hypothetical protein
MKIRMKIVERSLSRVEGYYLWLAGLSRPAATVRWAMGCSSRAMASTHMV